MISFNNIGNLGRLANQMFQYASLKGIARNRGYEFTIPPEDVFGQNDPLVKTSSLNIYNVFENEAATRMLFFRVEKKFYSILKPFLIFLNRLPEKVKGIGGEDIQTNHIPLNETTIKELRKIE